MIDRKGNELVVELQKDLEQQDDCTQVFGPDGAIVGAAGLQVGQGIEVEGVRVPADTDGDPELLRAALIIIDGDDAEERLSGTIAEPIDEDASSFFLITSTSANGGVTVILDPEASILVFDGDEQVPGDFDDILNGVGNPAEAFGELGTDMNFHATTVIVETGG
jgi:hypothetical protein